VGEWWRCVAKAHDGTVTGPGKTSAKVRIVAGVSNNKPTAPTTVTVTPKNPGDNAQLKATASGSTDADGDTLVYRYQWQKSTDNVNWVNGPAKRFVEPVDTTVGEWWRCQARAYDGKQVGPIKTSPKVQIVAGAGAAWL